MSPLGHDAEEKSGTLVEGLPWGGPVHALRRMVSMATFRKLNVSRVKDVDVVIFKDSKILDEELLDELRTELLAVVGNRPAPDVLLDFSNVEFMSSAMLGLLGVVHRKMKKADGRLKMCSIRPEIFTVFKLTNLDKLFSIYSDAGDAMKAFE